MEERYMELALAWARKAADLDEVPVGAVVVRDGQVVGEAHNRRELDGDPTAHAEILALRQAAKTLGGWRLMDCDVYVTLEPCPMCAGAMINSRVRHIYYGAADPKAGCCGTLMSLTEDERFNHRAPVVGGVLEEACAKVLKDFFRKKREKKDRS